MCLCMYECVYVYSCGVGEGKLNVLGFILCGWGGYGIGVCEYCLAYSEATFFRFWENLSTGGVVLLGSYRGPTGFLPVAGVLPGSFGVVPDSFRILIGFLPDADRIPTRSYRVLPGSYVGRGSYRDPTGLLLGFYRSSI